LIRTIFIFVQTATFLGLLFVLNRDGVFANPFVACAAVGSGSAAVIAGINAVRDSVL
jgi:hypothetical protein